MQLPAMAEPLIHAQQAGGTHQMISQDQQQVEVLLPAGFMPLPEQVHQLRGNSGSRPGDQMDLHSRSHSF